MFASTLGIKVTIYPISLSLEVSNHYDGMVAMLALLSLTVQLRLVKESRLTENFAANLHIRAFLRENVREIQDYAYFRNDSHIGKSSSMDRYII